MFNRPYTVALMQYLLWLGKLGLSILWAVLVVAACSEPLAKPFVELLGLLGLGLLLAHMLTLVLFGWVLKERRHVWLDRLQLLLFGAFHLQSMRLPQRLMQQQLAPAVSENRPSTSQTDQQHSDK